MERQAIERLKRKLGKTSLLIVDDTPIMRGGVSDILEPLGLRGILQAENGEQAWNLLQSGGVDIIVADWLMPGINGLELLKRMRADKRFAHIPFIMITGVPDKQAMAQAVEFGATDFMSKPVDGSVLKQKILKALSRKAV